MVEKQVLFSYSLNNIPMHSWKLYKINLYDQTNKFIERLRLKAHFFELDNNSNYRPYNTNNYYKFPTSTYAPFNKKVSRFAGKLLNIVDKVEFKKFNSNFQSKLRTDIKAIQKSKYIYTFADKTINVYQYRPEEHKKLLHDNITKDYKKASSNTLETILKLNTGSWYK